MKVKCVYKFKGSSDHPKEKIIEVDDTKFDGCCGYTPSNMLCNFMEEWIMNNISYDFEIIEGENIISKCFKEPYQSKKEKI